MLRLTVIAQSEEQVVLAVDGWLAGSAIDLLEKEIDRWSRKGKRLVLNMNDVRFVDHDGVILLRDRTGGELALEGGSAFVRELLRTHGLQVGGSILEGGRKP